MQQCECNPPVEITFEGKDKRKYNVGRCPECGTDYCWNVGVDFTEELKRRQG